jgi:hypothetical protein
MARPLLLLAALDSLLFGLWAVLRPADLFRLLGVRLPDDAYSLWQVHLGVLSREAMSSPRVRDAFLLWQLLGLLLLVHFVFLLLAALRPASRGGLALAPLLGRALQAGLWLWLLGTDRVSLPARPLAVLLAHDGLVTAALAGFLFLARRGGKGRSAASGGVVRYNDRKSAASEPN